ncbi:hypothetical protein EV140_1915 [Microcella alkaliphila]|uniref:Uncharacterized protein n=1 Tax=Microcella alkaliphila TaxID=279828 RepID=A0A4Q7THY4_9MICO|nr:hypothetical protein [Microcella alkaliphila]RZT59310.1 hypothetical protein EV140_1915 [Microcella alkaliphila]
MTAQPGLGITGNGVGVTTPIAHRLAQSGLVAKAGGTPNLVRAGVFYDGTVNIVTGTAGMMFYPAGEYTISPVVARVGLSAGSPFLHFINAGPIRLTASVISTL